MIYDEKYMQRALTLANRGLGYASPNPMVGAVIVHNHKIVGEGWHRLCGQAHAEVNAVNSIADKSILRDSTMYVTLEPCAHYGKTPPCALLIREMGIPRVVVGTVDPFSKVAGRGIEILREAGVEVVVGVLQRECRELNRRFFIAHTRRRPYITLKWAQSIDGFMDARRGDDNRPYRFSTPLTSIMTARLRSLNDAILTTAATVVADNPRLTVRGWNGRHPRPVVLDRRGVMPSDAHLAANDALLHIVGDVSLDEVMTRLYDIGITSVLVEAGPTLLSALIEAGLWDAARVEVAPMALGDEGRHPAPAMPLEPALTETFGQNVFYHYINPASAVD